MLQLGTLPDAMTSFHPMSLSNLHSCSQSLCSSVHVIGHVQVQVISIVSSSLRFYPNRSSSFKIQNNTYDNDLYTKLTERKHLCHQVVDSRIFFINYQLIFQTHSYIDSVIYWLLGSFDREKQ